MTLLNGFEVERIRETEIDSDVHHDFTIHKMKDNQRIVYSYKDTPYFILSEPPGAGKSTSIKFVANDLLIENPELRIIIAVPYTVNAKTFGDIVLEYPDGRQAQWTLLNNLCEDNGNESKVLAIKQFLEKLAKDLFQ